MGMFRMRQIGIILLILSFSIILFISCGKQENLKNKKIAEPERAQYIDEIKTNGENRLELPSRVIGSRKELTYALDFMRFNMISQTVKYKISDKYRKQIKSIYAEYETASQESDIAELSVNNLDSSQFDTEGIIKIKIKEGEVATKANNQDPNKVFVKNKDFLDAVENVKGDYNDFDTDKYLKGLDVENSEQLYYAVQNGYRPIVKAGSVAEKIYEKAKDILRKILNTGMSELEKAKQIFNYLTTEVQYDYKILEDQNAGNIEPYAYYLEGAILTQSAVCDGKSKAYVLLLAMAGIESKRVTAKDYDGNGHAYNYVKINGKWYLSCTTYGQVNDRYKQVGFKDSLIYSRYNMFLTNKNTELGKDDNGNNAWKYISYKNYEIYGKIEKEEIEDIRYKFHDWNALEKYLNENMSTMLTMYRSGKYPQYISMQIEILTKYSNDIQLEYKTSNITIRILGNRSYSKHIYTCIFRFN